MTAAAPATATPRQLKKAARKDFTRRGQLLTRIGQQVTRLGNNGSQLSGRGRGPVYEAQSNGHTTCGYLVALTRQGLSLDCPVFEDMTYSFRFGQLSTESLAQLVEVLVKMPA